MIRPSFALTPPRIARNLARPVLPCAAACDRSPLVAACGPSFLPFPGVRHGTVVEEEP